MIWRLGGRLKCFFLGHILRMGRIWRRHKGFILLMIGLALLEFVILMLLDLAGEWVAAQLMMQGSVLL